MLKLAKLLVAPLAVWIRQKFTAISRKASRFPSMLNLYSKASLIVTQPSSQFGNHPLLEVAYQGNSQQTVCYYANQHCASYYCMLY